MSKVLSLVVLGAGLGSACSSSQTDSLGDDGGPNGTGGSTSSTGGSSGALEAGTTFDSGHPSASTGSGSGSSGGHNNGASASSGSSGGFSASSSSGASSAGSSSSGSGSSNGSSSSSSGSSSSGGSSSGSSSGGAQCSGSTASGTQGWASRFWDCCRPSCSNSGAATCDSGGSNHVGNGTTSACSGGSAYACYDYSPTTASSCMAYGFAAFNGASCGTCYQLTFTGTASHGGGPGAAAIKGKQMIVQVVNIGGLQSNQFDIMIPGGGVGVNPGTCGGEWNLSTSQLGATYGGFLTTCEGQSSSYATQESCVTGMCATLPNGLQAGCNWLINWFQAADNPDLVYQQVTCPSALTQISGIQ